MKHSWLHKNDNSSLILYFAGWGMNGSEVSHLESGNFDVLCLYDYKDFEFDFSVLENYDELFLVAWSFGVSVANCLKIPVKKSLAFNGSLLPIDESFGIPEAAFDLTLSSLNEENYQKFLARTFGKNDDFSKLTFRKIEDQREELEIFGKNFKNFKNSENCFDVAVISSRDRIIPSKNQRQFWSAEKVEIVEISGAHYPFQNWKSWQEILSL